MENIIVQFIEDFKKYNKEAIEDLFLHGYCYYFAIILKERFSSLGTIMYIPIYNHFCYKVFDNLYDITGKITEEEYIKLAEPWDIYKEKDDREAKNLIIDCILKLPDKYKELIP